MLWVDAHRPTSLRRLDFGTAQAAALERMAECGDLPHMLFYGPTGAGKRTRVMALLRAVFGAGVERVRLDVRGFKTPTGRHVEVTTVSSPYHIEINPGDAGIYDRYVVQELIKEMAAYNVGASVGDGDGAAPPRKWKVLILSEVDRLTKEAQAALRRTMEKYTATCRLVLVATSPSTVIDPVKSRCVAIRVPAPSQTDIMSVLEGIAAKEGFPLPKPVAAKIAAQSSRNLRRAILMLEAAKVATPTLTPATTIPLMDWERYILLLGADIMREQSPKCLLACRSKVYELLVNCIPADTVLKRLTSALLSEYGRLLPDSFKHELSHWAAFYEHRLQLGQKELFHIEAFIAKVMSVIKLGGHGAVAASSAASAAAASAAPSLASGLSTPSAM